MLFNLEEISQRLIGYNLGEALRYLEKTGLRQSQPHCYFCLRSEVYIRAFDFKKAFDEIARSINLKSDWAPSHNICGNILVELGEFDKALESFNRAVDLEPFIGEYKFNRGQLLLLLGRWDLARPDYEFRLNSSIFQPPSAIAALPRWNGDCVPGKSILIYWEQGQGDTIQFIRFADDLIQKGMRVGLEVQESLVGLLSCSFPELQLVFMDDDFSNFECRASIPSLPWLLEINSEAYFWKKTYVKVPGNTDLTFAGTANGSAIGLVWAGNPNHVNDRQRSIPMNDLLSLTQVSGCSFYSLQYGTSEKVKRSLARVQVVDLATTFTDFADTAAAIQALDLVITVDTSVAHLAGALGKPVWILLPFVPDWRWMLNRSDSPWYPSARLFRQPRRGDWASVLKEVKQALVEFRDQRAANSAA
ncbi:tetratricopeptide repeat-containing glycosyltransferase family protein [Elstera cyanobacteriorum]|uniref:tetratricopeptide repeat-containing glycosyltransferase family protein n=1 Tax=Elstera cyanobacteriorum TaxID=2022747 RepID=UPI0023566EDB|nr:tetratricopeptide repeat-containing glycosyltransferase family protein [Elstera cyanobacteriorum]MCK6442369.1 tetratricopeptide repeat-containing glycosyltransferase family protein [Elstera cyanobacteriorum]